jgi:hypothetical protein
MFQKLPLSPLERVDMVSDATVGYIYSYPCPFLMMEAVSEILEMYSVMTWLTACIEFSAPYVVGLMFYFYLYISFYQLPIHHKLVSAALSPKNCPVCFGSWKTKQYSLMQCLSPGRCRVLHPIVRSVVFFIASYKVKANSTLMISERKVPTFWRTLTMIADSFEVSVPFTRLQIVTSGAGSSPHIHCS